MKRAGFLLCSIAVMLLAGCSWLPWGSKDEAPPAAAGAPVATTAKKADRRPPNTIRAGMAANYPPLSFREDGRFVGIEVDLARELVRESGLKITIRQMPWSALIPALQAGKIDVIMSGMAVTDARAAQFAFVEPYLRTGQMALVREQDAARLGPPARLRDPGRRIAVVRGSSGEEYVRRSLRQAEIVVFADSDAAAAALAKGRVDYFIHDAPSIWHFGMVNTPGAAGLVGLYTPLTEEYLAWAVRKDDPQLKAKLDAAVLAMKQRGVVDAIVRRWIDTQVDVTPVRPN
ncbi:MAG: transporter substrate-binding domain-containing protein [Betaproteobacteria bacterium]|nr:transporter substrate-binding domain-containing protein [Betaproteobacteria bacterium]